MRLLFVHQRMGAFGGAEANIHLTAEELVKRGHSVGLLYFAGTGQNEGQWQDTFPVCAKMPATNNSGWIRSFVAAFRPDVIYLHTISDLEVIETLLETSVPVVRMVHDHDLYCMRSYKYNYFTRKPCERPLSARCIFPCMGFLVRSRGSSFPVRFQSYSHKKRELALNRRCRTWIVYSEFSKNELVRNGFDPARIMVHVPIHCWPNEVPTSTFSPRNLILFAGQIIRGKGVDVLLQALRLVRAPFECLILGDGNHRGYCEELRDNLGLRGKVQFQGFVPSGQMRDFYLDASAFAMPSVWPEPFGMAGPEAMRYGVPVVAFDSGGIREWLHDRENGFLVPWMDKRAFAAGLEKLLLDKPLARDLGRRGMEFVNRQYAAPRQIDSLEDMFRRFTGESRCDLSATNPTFI